MKKAGQNNRKPILCQLFIGILVIQSLKGQILTQSSQANSPVKDTRQPNNFINAAVFLPFTKDIIKLTNKGAFLNNLFVYSSNTTEEMISLNCLYTGCFLGGSQGSLFFLQRSSFHKYEISILLEQSQALRIEQILYCDFLILRTPKSLHIFNPYFKSSIEQQEKPILFSEGNYFNLVSSLMTRAVYASSVNSIGQFDLTRRQLLRKFPIQGGKLALSKDELVNANSSLISIINLKSSDSNFISFDTNTLIINILFIKTTKLLMVLGQNEIKIYDLNRDKKIKTDLFHHQFISAKTRIEPSGSLSTSMFILGADLESIFYLRNPGTEAKRLSLPFKLKNKSNLFRKTGIQTSSLSETHKIHSKFNQDMRKLQNKDDVILRPTTSFSPLYIGILIFVILIILALLIVFCFTVAKWLKQGEIGRRLDREGREMDRMIKNFSKCTVFKVMNEDEPQFKSYKDYVEKLGNVQIATKVGKDGDGIFIPEIIEITFNLPTTNKVLLSKTMKRHPSRKHDS